MKYGGYWTFETPLGWCGIAWADADGPQKPYAVTHFYLPEAAPERMESRLARECGAGKAARLPPPIGTIVNRVTKHLRGEAQDFRDIPVNLEGAGEFLQRVCQAARQIPAGKTATYSEIAKAIGQPAAARAVGRALGMNPIPLIIPCHRVVGAGGKPGGFSAPGGRVTKAKLLALEGAVVNLCLDLTAGS